MCQVEGRESVPDDARVFHLFYLFHRFHTVTLRRNETVLSSFEQAERADGYTYVHLSKSGTVEHLSQDSAMSQHFLFHHCSTVPPTTVSSSPPTALPSWVLFVVLVQLQQDAQRRKVL